MKINLKDLLKRALMVDAQEVRLVPGRRTVVITATGENEVRGDVQTPERINADAAGPETGLARLVLTLIEVLRKVLEHQAVRRMEGGRLTDDEVERLGLALAKLNDRMGELKRVFGLSEEDLQIDLGPLGRLR